MCHENAAVLGRHADLNAEFLNSLHPYTELAIGGGNPLAHPDLIPFLRRMRDQRVLCNMTVHHDHFMANLDPLKEMSMEKLIWGLGVSLPAPCAPFPTVSKEFIDAVRMFPNAVVHVIAGVVNPMQIAYLSDKGIKLLILGYKNLRRGEWFYRENREGIDANMDWLRDNLQQIMPLFDVVCLDNLAIEQLDPRRFIPDEQWETLYMGDDGTHTMYIDLVSGEYAISSTAKERHTLLPSVDEMFGRLGNE